LEIEGIAGHLEITALHQLDPTQQDGRACIITLDHDLLLFAELFAYLGQGRTDPGRAVKQKALFAAPCGGWNGGR